MYHARFWHAIQEGFGHGMRQGGIMINGLWSELYHHYP